MCKRNAMIAASLIAGGAGLLLGLLINGAFLKTAIAIGLIAVGIFLLQR